MRFGIGLEDRASKISSKWQLIRKILAFRGFHLLCMILSSAIIPDHNPGDDVHRFDLQLIDGDDASKACFCLAGQACANSELRGVECAIVFHKPETTAQLSSHFWTRLLSPFTKWDAARFLHIAAKPQLRYPPLACIKGEPQCDFTESEQAHAFLPLFPLVIRLLAALWMYLVPQFLWPPTYACLLVLVGVTLNVVCSVIGGMALYSLTLSILPTGTLTKIPDRQTIATSVCLVYTIWNPALVFFATNYSESMFGALTLSGHWAFVQKRYLLAMTCWMLASWTRSNGTIHSLWLLIHMVGHICRFLRKSTGTIAFLSMLAKNILYLVGAVCIFLPVRYHDWNGYAAHCEIGSPLQPDWCKESALSFSLYAWTQRRHWNVGPLHYYQTKQIPNFLLAAPILILSILGVFSWIERSLKAFGKGKIPQEPYLLLVQWPVVALSKFSEGILSVDAHEVLPYAALVENPSLLGHYAILAGLTIVGLIVAHVQISTRMTMSSTPAIVWFLTYCHLQRQRPRLQQFVSLYTALFMVLGLILHVNFLPWT